MAKCKVLFISAPIGAGHIQAAKAISKILEKHYDGIESKFANVFDFFNPLIGKSILKIYLKILDIFPKMYGMMYGWGNNSTFALAGREIISGYLAARMQKYIEDYNPTIIVCTHATPLGLVAHLIKKRKLNIPVVAIITDFVVHRLWVYQQINKYIVSNSNMAQYLEQYGIKQDNIKKFGIPVDDKFLLPIDKVKLLKECDFSAKLKTILIMGGGAGILPMDEIVLSCEKLNIPLQIIVVTGKNKKMYNKLLNIQSSFKSKVKVLGYVNNIHELMSIADILISKPGGLTSAEALAVGLPMLIYRPIPGQEEANTQYLVGYNVAVCAQSKNDLENILKKLFIDAPNKLIEMKNNTIALGHPRAAHEIAEYITTFDLY